MQIEVTTDHNVQGSAALIVQIKADVDSALSRFGDRITRVEAHLADENPNGPGTADKRCTLEARPAGSQPVAVTNHATTVDEAYSGALDKLENLLERRFGRLDDHKGGDTIRQNEDR